VSGSRSTGPRRNAAKCERSLPRARDPRCRPALRRGAGPISTPPISWPFGVVSGGPVRLALNRSAKHCVVDGQPAKARLLLAWWRAPDPRSPR
jgi:hypothetical protein